MEKYAKEHPEEEVVFLSVGFETTTPAGCLSVKKAEEEGITNYSMLIANKTMPQAYEALKGSADIFLYPGHVNAIIGTKLCEELVQEGVSGVVRMAKSYGGYGKVIVVRHFNGLERSTYEVIQILSISLMDKSSLNSCL